MFTSGRLLALFPFLAALLAGPLAAPAAAQVFNATPATLGAIPDSVGECVGADGPPLFVSIPASGLVGGLTSVSATMTIAHSWMGEVTATLISPDGTEHVLFGRTGANGPPGWGFRRTVNGAYTFNDAAGGNWWTAADAAGDFGLVPPAAYRTSALGNGTPSSTGALTTMNPVFANREGNGIWRVRFTDSCRLDIGTVSALSLTLSTNGIITAPVAATPDAYTAGRNTPLSVAAPGVLANDINSAGSGALTATLTAPPMHGTLTLNANGSFLYTPATGYLGADSFSYFASNLAGSTPSTTVSITVVPVQPPTQFRVERVAGNLVTVRWMPPAVGPRPTSYVMEGGFVPGQVVAAVPSPAPALTLMAPTGSFFLRVRALDGDTVSGVSNEIPLHVNTTVTPSAPSGLTGLVNNDVLALSWRLTYGGGEPTNVFLDVSGAINASVPIGAVDSFSLGGVPPGTYTFAVRSQNAGGVSTASNPVTLTFPGACSGAPTAPTNYLFYKVGNAVYLVWDPPATGTAATGYVLNVTSPVFNGPLPVGAARSLTTSVPAGTYNVSVSAVNSCGTSPATAVQSVTIP